MVGLSLVIPNGNGRGKKRYPHIRLPTQVLLGPTLGVGLVKYVGQAIYIWLVGTKWGYPTSINRFCVWFLFGEAVNQFQLGLACLIKLSDFSFLFKDNNIGLPNLTFMLC
jgi:hypothetical protein